MDTVAIVLAGGTGSRLYPASRSDRPKQFLPLLGEESLLARTVDRAAFADDVVVATREAFADEIPSHAPDAEVLVEPAGKDTGPAVAYATHRVRERYDDPVVVVLPSDHYVGDDDAFRETMHRGVALARDADSLVTFGVEPDRPDTGYGYVEPAGPVGDDGAAPVAAFHEKPDADTAERYVESGYLWNAGIFAWRPDAFLAAARDSPLAPLVDALDAGDPAAGFDAVDPVSVDYAVMERADDVAVVPADFPWDDLGSWDALARLLDADEAGNAVLGEALTVDAADNVVAGDKHVSLVGVEGLAVVAWDDRVLVVPKAAAQRVREVVKRLQERGAF